MVRREGQEWEGLSLERKNEVFDIHDQFVKMNFFFHDEVIYVLHITKREEGEVTKENVEITHGL